MLRITKVYNNLVEKCRNIAISDIESGFEGVSAQELSQELNIDRANISRDLNELNATKKVVKVQGRPVNYFPVEILEMRINKKISCFETSSLKEFIRLQDEEDSFKSFIGYDGSMKISIQKAKAAMIYPPMGLHTLLVGDTGVGKTMFAELMYKYSKKQGVLNEDSPFISFNCAEYANNPQLLMTKLFGVVKGAYTGANSDVSGIVESANNGILFLDEIHRLPMVGQEMLFTLLDKGQYNKLGDNETTYKAKVLIIAATTEKVESVLLRTFLRRIPMTINIPSLDSRSIKERFELIKHFFYQEYNKVKIPIHISLKAMKALLCYRCSENVGQLKADIQLLCAQGFLEYKVKNRYDYLKIKSVMLPEHIFTGLFEIQNDKSAESFINTILQSEFIFDEEKYFNDIHIGQEDIYSVISQKYEDCLKNNLPKEKTRSLLRAALWEQINEISRRLPKEDKDQNIEKIIVPRILEVTKVALNIAENKLKKKYSNKVLVALALHISALMERKASRTLGEKDFITLVQEHPEEYEISMIIKDFIEEELELDLEEQEAAFITMFLCITEGDRKLGKVGLLVLAHGNGIAENMIEVSNTLLNTNHGHGLDMPLKQPVNEFLEVVIKKVKEIDEGKGVLILADMGSLIYFDKIIKERTGIDIRIVSLVATPLVLEALRKTMLPDYTLEDVYLDLKKDIKYLSNIGSKAYISNKQQFTIICTCITGEGAAIKIGNLIKSSLPAINEYGIDIITCNEKTSRNLNLKSKNILAIVGSVDIGIEEVEYISSESLIMGKGLNVLSQLISEKLGLATADSNRNYNLLDKMLEETLQFINPIKARFYIEESFKSINKYVNIVDYDRALITYIIHTGAMIERCMTNKTFRNSNHNLVIEENKLLYKAIKSSVEDIESFFQIKIPDEEISYIMEIFL